MAFIYYLHRYPKWNKRYAVGRFLCALEARIQSDQS